MGRFTFDKPADAYWLRLNSFYAFLRLLTRKICELLFALFFLHKICADYVFP